MAPSEATLALRTRLMQRIVDGGSVPAAQQLAAAVGCDVTVVRAAFAELAEHHVVALDAASGELRMVHPFSAVETPFSVRIGPKRWWGNCIWDALGIAGLFAEEALIETSCPDCGEPLTLRTSAARELAGDGVVHFAVPAARWYENIVDT